MNQLCLEKGRELFGMKVEMFAPAFHSSAEEYYRQAYFEVFDVISVL